MQEKSTSMRYNHREGIEIRNGRSEMQKRFSIILFLVVSLLIVNCSFCFAVRPLYTEDARVTPKSVLKLECGLLLLSNRDNTGAKELSTSFKYGFGKDLDLTAEIPYLSKYSDEDNYDGLANGTVKFKYNFYNAYTEFASFQIGYLPGNPSLNITTHSDINTMLIYSSLLDDLSYNLNFGYTFDGDRSGAPLEDFIIYNVSIAKPMNDSINLMGEMQYSRDTLIDFIVGEFAIGLNYKLNDQCMLDAALGCGLNENSSSLNFVVGFTHVVSL